MKARKILAVSLTAAMTLALAACGGSSSSSDKGASSKESSSDKVYKIGICQQLEHAALDEATKDLKKPVKKNSEKTMSNLIFRTDRASRQTVQQS